MNTKSEDNHIRECLKQIEGYVDLGSSKNWTNHDFNNLSEIILQKTHVKLSVTTLKRIWGKVKYESAPTVTTLNALAMVAGYENWRCFLQQTSNFKEPEVSLSNENTPPKKHKIPVFYWVTGLLLILVTTTVFLLYKDDLKINEEDYEFSSTKSVLTGVPNSVIFNYNASTSPSDSIFIQQSWDTRRRQLVSKNNKHHTSIYYYPGYFRAKLVVGDQVVKEHDIYITSNGWTAALDLEPVPAYLESKEFYKDGIVDVTPAMIEALNVSLQPKVPQLRIHNVQKIKNLKTDNFTFKTTVRHNFNRGTGICQKLQILILCKNDVFIIPLSSKRCIGDLFLSVAEKYIDSKKADLSGFGCELSEWTKIRVESRNKIVSIYVNDQNVYEVVFDNPPAEIVGVQYRFEGVGSVKETSFRDGVKEILL